MQQSDPGEQTWRLKSRVSLHPHQVTAGIVLDKVVQPAMTTHSRELKGTVVTFEACALKLLSHNCS